MQVWHVMHAARWKYRTQKIAILAPSHNFVRPYLRNWGMYRQSEKLVKQQYILHMSCWYGELRPTNGWDLLASPGHPGPCKFQRGFASWQRYCSSERLPNFAALNRGRYLYSTGWPSRWALAHILVAKLATGVELSINLIIYLLFYNVHMW